MEAVDISDIFQAGDTMTDSIKLHFGKGDWLAIGIVAVLAFAVMACFFPAQNDPAGYAQIYLDGKLYQTVSLDQDTSFLVTDQYSNEITVTNGTIAFTKSNCPGQDCVHSGSIHSTGRSLVCLPNRVEIRVVSTPDDVDFVVG